MIYEQDKPSPPKMVDRLWEVVKGCDYGRFSGSFFKSIKIYGNWIELEVNYKNISQLKLEMREYEYPYSYAVEQLVHQFGKGYKLPDNIGFFFRFGPYNFMVIKNMEY